jgi:mono/diheme cytochrome c family protein
LIFARGYAHPAAFTMGAAMTFRIGSPIFFPAIACSAITLVTMLLAGPAAAETAERGRQILTENCSSCHAVGRTGSSPLPHAPQFRKLADRFDMADLERRMRRGLSSMHSGMPTFRFNRSDARAVRIYLDEIQQ